MDTTTTTNDSENFASLIELGGPTGDFTARESERLEVEAPVVDLENQSPPPSRPIPGVTVDQAGVRRAKADEEAAIKAGHSLKPPVYTLGTLVNSTGVENFKASRKEWDALPLLGEGCQEIIAQVAKEQREDLVAEVPSLYMDEMGKLVVAGQGYPMTKRGIEGLSHFTTQSGGKYLSEIPADLRAYNFNRHFPLGFRVDKRATTKQYPDGTSYEEMEKIYTPNKVTIRTRQNGEGREVYAVTGPRYGTFDINQVVGRIYKALSDKNLDARVDAVYDGYKLRFDVLFHTDVQPEKAVAGEIFKAGLIIRTADDGSGAINVSTELHRNLCLNLIILDHSKVLVGRRRHSGKQTTIEESIDNALKQAQENLGYFAQAWSHANVENVLERYDLGDPRDVFNGLVLNKLVWTPGMRPEDQVNRLMSAWNEEPGYSKSAFINAITRMAHTAEHRSWETVEELESTAGELLFAKQWNLDVKGESVEDVLGGW